ncbi:hypothetical protein CHS0354_026271 [Potamilus streckersoni]|uniref:Cell division cycle protein 20 homolog n=1 Tax=Potamilus streckersoni TaxID=2493646 RepID=A0AAE0W527_9BIVA|nr:hypothetical protein CHS0354_026271 [Potamilus streckersoni]
MNHFSLENEISSAVRMDAPITRGPALRWQRKMNESGADASTSGNILNVSCGPSKTPMKSMNRSMTQSKTPSTGSSASKTPKSGGKSKTPNKPKTPIGGDRFIPNRSTTQFELGYYKLTTENAGQPDEENLDLMSPSKMEYQKIMSENLHGDLLNSKIISYKSKAPGAPEGYHNGLKVLYSSCKTPIINAKKTVRHIPQVPERILDAPEVLDDYYLNLLDWSANNQLAVCLGGSVYLWNASTGDITQLLQLETSEEYVGAVAWVKEGNYLAVGCSTGEVQLWDIAQEKRLRNMTGHVARVGSLSWNGPILSSGSRSGNIHHHDVRMVEHHVGTFSGHSQEVCGLKWSPDGRYLASGGNDNLLNIWGANVTDTSPQPTYVFSQHLAAVKALAWCPWQPSVLASGGGTADRHIRFWNCATGSCLDSVDTKSQVCAILWSKEYKELISSHGFALNQLTIWKYPTMTKVAELTGHSSRVLHMAMSPDGSTVVSAGADETLRLWKCFALDEEKKKAMKSVSKDKHNPITQRSLIR